MIVGTQYYRPPNPRREDWARDLRLIKEHGLRLIRTWLYWGRVNPDEDVWVWDDYDELLDLAEENGLRVLVQLMCDSPPLWLERKHPECRYVDAQGRYVEFYAKPSQSVGGAPGPCFHNPTSRSYGEKFMRKTAERYRDHPALYAYDLWNEVWMSECFCEHTQEWFRRFLKQKYGSIEALNDAWQRRYRSFSEVSMPKRGVYADMIDRYEFEQWSRAELMRWRYKVVRSADQEHMLVSHYIGACSLMHPDHDPWMLAEPLDGWGTSSYDKTLHEAALTFHATSCASQGKPWWLSEHTGGRTWSNVGERLRSDEFLRSFLVLAMGFGAEAAIYWQWRPEIFGQESPHFGLTGLDGEPTSRTRMVKEFTEMLRRHADIFDGMVFPEAQVGLLWEPRTIMYEEISRGRARERWLWWRNFVGWHKALMESGIQFDILNAREISEKGLPAGLRLIIAPMQIFERRGLIGELEGWIGQGGHLVAGPWFGMYDEQTYVNRRVPPVDWFGVRQLELYYMQRPRIEFISEELSRIRFIPAAHFIESLEVMDAETLGTVGENVVVTAREYGRGRAVYVGTFLGNPYDYEESPQLGGFIEWAAEKAGVEAPAHVTSGCILRAARTDGGTIIFLTNPQARPVTAWLRFPPERKETLTDLLTDKDMGRIDGEGPIRLSLAAEDSRLLYLH